VSKEEQNKDEFSEYRRMILADIKRLQDNDAAILAKLELISASIVELKVKAAVFGALAGVIMGLVTAWMAKKI